MVRAMVNSRRRLQHNGVIVHATISKQRRLQWLPYMDLVLSFMPRLIHGVDYRTMVDINRRRILQVMKGPQR